LLISWHDGDKTVGIFSTDYICEREREYVGKAVVESVVMRCLKIEMKGREVFSRAVFFGLVGFILV